MVIKFVIHVSTKVILRFSLSAIKVSLTEYISADYHERDSLTEAEGKTTNSNKLLV